MTQSKISKDQEKEIERLNNIIERKDKKIKKLKEKIKIFEKVRTTGGSIKPVKSPSTEKPVLNQSENLKEDKKRLEIMIFVPCDETWYGWKYGLYLTVEEFDEELYIVVEGEYKGRKVYKEHCL